MLATKTKIRIARSMSRALCRLRAGIGKSPQAEVVHRNGFRWSLDLREGIDLAVYLCVYERETTRAIRRAVKPGSLVLDIGANIGVHTLELARCVGSGGRVISFEPTAFAIERLRRHLELNPDVATRVTVEQIMLAATGRTTAPEAIYSRWPLAPAADLHAVHCGKLESTAGARAVPLDDYLNATGSRPVDFIKLDVDGFECDVLSGGRTCLAEDQPVILLELAPYGLREQAHSLAELVAQLQAAGYRLYSLSGAMLPDCPAALERRITVGGGINAVARVDGGANGSPR